MNIYLDNDTDISKIDIKTKIIFVLVVLVVLINHIRFDNTELKNVDMEPFSEPVQQEIKNGKTFEHEVSGRCCRNYSYCRLQNIRPCI